MRPHNRVWLATVLLALAASCSLTQRGESELPVPSTLLTPVQEAQLGEQLYQQFSRSGLRLSKDALVTAYLDGVLTRLSGKGTVHLIDDASTVSAFSTPGGHIYVTTGLMLGVDSEAELAGVLAHELGHLAAHHPTRQLVSEFGRQTLVSVAVGEDPSLLEQLALSLALHGSLLNHSRADEREADAWALRSAAGGGWDPRGIALFFRKLPTKPRDPYTWLQQHPAASDRIEHVNQVIAREHLAGTRVGTEELKPIQLHLSQQADESPPAPEPAKRGGAT